MDLRKATAKSTGFLQGAVPVQTLRKIRGTTGVDDDFAARGFNNVGAWILGRNMFSPDRGPWPDMAWKGWWGHPDASRASAVRCCKGASLLTTR
jgi:dihydrofolate reductase